MSAPDKRNQMTLTLNGPALNQLIELHGGDEFVLKLRHAVLENVIRHRSKALVDQKLDAALTVEIANQVKQVIGSVVPASWNKPGKVDLVPAFQEAINTLAAQAAYAKASELEKLFESRMAKDMETMWDRIQHYLDAIFQREVKMHVDAEVRRRMEAALKSGA